MKLFRGLLLLSFLFGVASCFNPPEYSFAPQIDFDAVKFIESSDPSTTDVLAISLLFKDGNGDIGLSDADLVPSQATKQYAQHTYFTTNGSKVVTDNRYITRVSQTL